jgi:hypothetical protein
MAVPNIETVCIERLQDIIAELSVSCSGIPAG